MLFSINSVYASRMPWGTRTLTNKCSNFFSDGIQIQEEICGIIFDIYGQLDNVTQCHKIDNGN